MCVFYIYINNTRKIVDLTIGPATIVTTIIEEEIIITFRETISNRKTLVKDVGQGLELTLSSKKFFTIFSFQSDTSITVCKLS